MSIRHELYLDLLSKSTPLTGRPTSQNWALKRRVVNLTRLEGGEVEKREGIITGRGQ